MQKYTEADLATNPNLSVISMLDETGDTKLIWDRTNPAEVANARRTFDELKKQGHAAFRVGVDGGKDVQMHEFDPAAEKMIMVPQMRGG